MPVHKALSVQPVIRVPQDQQVPKAMLVPPDLTDPLVRMVRQELGERTVRWVHPVNQVNKDRPDLVAFVVNADLLAKRALMANPVMMVLPDFPVHM